MSEKVQATIPKDIVGGFEFTVLQRNLKEAIDVCLRMLNEESNNKLQCQQQRNDHIPYYLSGLSGAHFFRQPFSK